MNLFAEWLAHPCGQWNDWLTQRVLEYPYAVQEAVRQEAEAYQRAWSREQDHTRQTNEIARWRREQEAERLERLVRQAADELERRRRAEEYAQREQERLDRIRRIEEHSRQQL